MRNAICKKKVDVERGIITFNFTTGQPLVVDLNKCNAQTITQLALHGLSQKIGDSYSGVKVCADGFSRASETWNTLLAGEWSVGKTGNDGNLIEALMKVMSKGKEECTAAVERMPKEKKKALAASPKIAATIMYIKLAKLRETMKEGGEDKEVNYDDLFAVPAEES